MVVGIEGRENLKQYKTTLIHRESQKRYRLKHLESQRLASRKWKDNHSKEVKMLRDKWSDISNPKRIVFLGKRIRLPATPRTGECSCCNKRVTEGEIKRTNMHHFEYDERNPLSHTAELCVSCHRKIHRIDEKMKYIPDKLKRIFEREDVNSCPKTIEELWLVEWLFHVGEQRAPIVPTDENEYDPLVEGEIPRLKIVRRGTSS